MHFTFLVIILAFVLKRVTCCYSLFSRKTLPENLNLDQNRIIFREKWGADTYANTLANPCRAEPTPFHWANDTVLKVDSTRRAAEIASVAKALLSRVGYLENDLVSIYVLLKLYCANNVTVFNVL